MVLPFLKDLMCVGVVHDNSAWTSAPSRSKNDSENLSKTSHKPTMKSSSVLAAITLAFLGGLAVSPTIGHAQTSGEQLGEQLFGEAPSDPQSQLLLESDELIYDDAAQTVSAVGNVQIAYDDYTLVAQRVTYDRNTGRVIATGGVEIIEPNGNKVFAEEIDITDDFQDGFVRSLRVETPDRTRFAAESAERRDGDIAVFNNGVYTACDECPKDKTKPPLWQIRADRVIVNNRTRRVEYEGASFELYGMPIAYLSKFSHADPSIKRASGFLFPGVAYDEKLGFSATGSYFWALAPNYDLTLSGTYYNKQGFLGDAEWRHKTELGTYNIRYAGINQNGQDEFDNGTVDNQEDDRHALMTTGRFSINPRWKFGWNALFQTDRNFAQTYNLTGYDEARLTNEAYLTGLNGKNYFDLRAQKFIVQNESALNKVQDQQATVLPSFDYNVVSDNDTANGQISLDINATRIKRDLADIRNDDLTDDLQIDERHHGLVGESTRATAEIEWKRSQILHGGAMVTASLSGRADGIWQDTENLNSATNPLINNDSILRTMPAAMLEIRYPMIANDGLASHIFEPIAQVIFRPDETHIGKFANEDAQSFVFDTSNLFARNKFSGFDRVEGGTRANVGFQYSATFEQGASFNLVAGQSFHLHGKNSFAERDLVNAGINSGLETDRSDYVASVNLNTGTGLTLGAAGRFDEKDGELQRGDISARYVAPSFAGQLSYAFINQQPEYSFAEDRQEISGSASLKLDDHWRVFGAAKYDLQNQTLFSRSIGISYDCSCFSLSVSYSDIDDRYTGDSTERAINFSIGLRTIGTTTHKRVLE